MKKRLSIVMVVVLLVTMLSGCRKNKLEADEVGALFVDYFIYQEQEESFKENFVDGDFLSKQLLLMTNTFEDTFSGVFDSVVDFTTDEKEEISAGLMKSVRDKSKYQETTEKIDKNRIQVQYKIHGLDYSDLVEKTLANLFKELMTSQHDLPENNKEILIKTFDESLKSAESTEKEVEISLVFEKNKNKWELSENQDAELEELLFSFISGANDKEEYEKEMSTMLERVVDNATNER